MREHEQRRFGELSPAEDAVCCYAALAILVTLLTLGRWLLS